MQGTLLADLRILCLQGRREEADNEDFGKVGMLPKQSPGIKPKVKGNGEGVIKSEA